MAINFVKWRFDKESQKELEDFFRRSEVLAAYVFGSIAMRPEGRARDIDISVLLFPDRVDECNTLTYLSELTADLMSITGENNVDLHLLNRATPLLGMNVLKTGELIYCKDHSVRSSIENRIRREYIDTAPLRRIKEYYLRKKYVARS